MPIAGLARKSLAERPAQNLGDVRDVFWSDIATVCCPLNFFEKYFEGIAIWKERFLLLRTNSTLVLHCSLLSEEQFFRRFRVDHEGISSAKELKIQLRR